MSSSVPREGSFSPILGSGFRWGRMRHASKNRMSGRGTVCMMVPDRQCRIIGVKGSCEEQAAGPNHAITQCCLSMAYPQMSSSSVRWSGNVNLWRVSYALCTMCSNCEMCFWALGILLALTSTSRSRRKTTPHLSLRQQLACFGAREHKAEQFQNTWTGKLQQRPYTITSRTHYISAVKNQDCQNLCKPGS